MYCKCIRMLLKQYPFQTISLPVRERNISVKNCICVKTFVGRDIGFCKLIG